MEGDKKSMGLNQIRKKGYEYSQKSQNHRVDRNLTSISALLLLLLLSIFFSVGRYEIPQTRYAGTELVDLRRLPGICSVQLAGRPAAEAGCRARE